MNKQILSIIFFLLFLSFSSLVFSQERILIYKGEIIDQQASPISAVLPLTFQLYKSQKSTSPFSSFSSFVSVINGQYTIEIPVPSGHLEFYLAVIWQKTELLRQHILPSSIKLKRSKYSSGGYTLTSKHSFGDEMIDLTCPEGMFMVGILLTGDLSQRWIQLKCQSQ